MAFRQHAGTGSLIREPVAQPDEAPPTMHVKIYSPYQTYLDDEAYSLSAVNSTGPFDILPKHHNFITLLNPCEMAVRLPGGLQRIRISRGVMHVKADRIVVFLNV